ncbi:hypothetical protein VTO73DRAFT_8813 [Trametes versicolor]
MLLCRTRGNDGMQGVPLFLGIWTWIVLDRYRSLGRSLLPRAFTLGYIPLHAFGILNVPHWAFPLYIAETWVFVLLAGRRDTPRTRAKPLWRSLYTMQLLQSCEGGAEWVKAHVIRWRGRFELEYAHGPLYDAASKDSATAASFEL